MCTQYYTVEFVLGKRCCRLFFYYLCVKVVYNKIDDILSKKYFRIKFKTIIKL